MLAAESCLLSEPAMLPEARSVMLRPRLFRRRLACSSPASRRFSLKVCWRLTLVLIMMSRSPSTSSSLLITPIASSRGSSVNSLGSLLKLADWLLLYPLLRDRLPEGRKMMLVIESGFHSRRKLEFQLLLLLRLKFSLLLKAPREVTKLLVDDQLRLSLPS